LFGVIHVFIKWYDVHPVGSKLSAIGKSLFSKFWT